MKELFWEMLFFLLEHKRPVSLLAPPIFKEYLQFSKKAKLLVEEPTDISYRSLELAMKTYLQISPTFLANLEKWHAELSQTKKVLLKLNCLPTRLATNKQENYQKMSVIQILNKILM